MIIIALKKKFFDYSCSKLTVNDTLVSRNAKGIYNTRKILHVGSYVRTFSSKKQISKSLLMVLKQKIQIFSNYVFAQILVFCDFLTKNLIIFEYILNNIIVYELIRTRNILMYYIRIGGLRNTSHALFRLLQDSTNFIPLFLCGFCGVVSTLFSIGFLEDPYSQQLNICHTEMTALVKGSLDDYDAVQFRQSLNYLLHASQDQQLREIVKQMCQIHDQKINIQYNMENIYPKWTDQHATAVADSQAPYVFVAKVCFGLLLCVFVLALLNINEEAFVPPINDLPEAFQVQSPASEGVTTNESLSP